jgi:polypeptide N-acetylgalactosaminyltransferase
MADDNCLDAADGRSPVKLIRCHGMAGKCPFSIFIRIKDSLFDTESSDCSGNQMWDYNWDLKTLVHVNTGLCLTKADSSKDSTLPLLKKCSGKRSQKWLLQSNFKWQASDHETKIGEGEDEE